MHTYRERARAQRKSASARERERESERKIALSLFLSLSDSLPSPPPPLSPRRLFIIVYVHNPGRHRDPHRALVRGQYDLFLVRFALDR